MQLDIVSVSAHMFKVSNGEKLVAAANALFGNCRACLEAVETGSSCG